MQSLVVPGLLENEQYVSQVFRTALTSSEHISSSIILRHALPPLRPTPVCLSPGLLVLLGYMLSITTSPLPGSHQVQAYFHTCEYSRSPRAERHADVCLGTAVCPHQERLSQVGRAAPAAPTQLAFFREEGEPSAQTEWCYSPLQVPLWNPCQRENVLTAYKMYTSEYVQRLALL